MCTDVVGHLLPATQEKVWQFNGEANVIAELYSSLLGHVGIDKLGKIRINLYDGDYSNSICAGYSCSRTLGMEKRFDFTTYFSLPHFERKVMLLEEMQTHILYACNEFKFDSQPFVDAYEKVKKANYVAKYTYKNKIFKNKNKTLGASLVITLEGTHAQFTLVFYDKNEEVIKEVDCLKTFNNFMFIDTPVKGGVKWLDNEQIVLLNKDKEVTVKVSITGEVVSNHLFNPEKLKLL